VDQEQHLGADVLQRRHPTRRVSQAQDNHHREATRNRNLEMRLWRQIWQKGGRGWWDSRASSLATGDRQWGSPSRRADATRDTRTRRSLHRTYKRRAKKSSIELTETDQWPALAGNPFPRHPRARPCVHRGESRQTVAQPLTRSIRRNTRNDVSRGPPGAAAVAGQPSRCAAVRHSPTRLRYHSPGTRSRLGTQTRSLRPPPRSRASPVLSWPRVRPPSVHRADASRGYLPRSASGTVTWLRSGSANALRFRPRSRWPPSGRRSPLRPVPRPRLLRHGTALVGSCRGRRKRSQPRLQYTPWSSFQGVRGHVARQAT
jgi:hypothetical protein